MEFYKFKGKTTQEPNKTSMLPHHKKRIIQIIVISIINILVISLFFLLFLLFFSISLCLLKLPLFLFDGILLPHLQIYFYSIPNIFFALSSSSNVASLTPSNSYFCPSFSHLYFPIL